MAVIPLSEYRRLMAIVDDDAAEEARHIVVAKKLLADVKSGKPKTIPSSIVKAIDVHGVHPVRAFRDSKGWTAQQLADKTGLSRAAVSHADLAEPLIYPLRGLPALHLTTASW